MPKRASDYFYDQAAKDSINLARLEAGSAAKAKAFLGGLESDLVKILADNKDLSPGKQAKLEAILKSSQDAIAETYDDLKADNTADLKGVADYQSKTVGKTMNAIVGADVMGNMLTENQIGALVKDKVVFGHSSAEWWDAQEAGLKANYAKAIQTGYALGEDVDQLTRRIRGTKAAGFTDGVMAISKREAEALVRTSVQTISNTAKMESFKAMSDTIKGIEWLATLDTRTTPICRALDGKTWTYPGLKPVGHVKVFPGPIAHWQCRSTQIPVLYSWAELSGKKIKALDGATYAEKLKEKLKAKGMSDDMIAKAEANARASMDGQASGSPDMQAWLQKQPDQKVKDMLGPTRANLLAQGKITATDLTDQNNRPLTIAQLHQGIADGFPVETEGTDFAPFDLAKAKPPKVDESVAIQKAASDKIAAVLADPKAKGNSILADNLAKVQAAEPTLSPAETLAKAEEATAAKIAANTKSSVLSKAKKKILAGEEPTAAQKALIDTLGDDEKAAWDEAIGDAVKAAKADAKAAKVAKLDAAIPGIVQANLKTFKTPDDIESFFDVLDTDGLDYFEKSALKDKITKGVIDTTSADVKAKVTAALKANPDGDPYQGEIFNSVWGLADLDGKAAQDLEAWVFGEIAKTTDAKAIKAWKQDPTKVFAIEAAEKNLGADATPTQILAEAKGELKEIVATNVWTDGTAASKKAVKAITGMDSPSPHALKDWMDAQGKDAETFLAEWKATTAAKAQQAIDSSVLSKAKKKILAGEKPTPAQQALIDSLDPDAKAAFDDAVADAKGKADALKAKDDALKAQAAADAAAKAAKLEDMKKTVVAGLPLSSEQWDLMVAFTPEEKKAFNKGVADLSAEVKLAEIKAAADAKAAQEAADKAKALADQQAKEAKDAKAAAKKAADAAAKKAQQAADAKTAADAQALAQQTAQQAKTAQADLPHPDDLKIVGKLGGSTGAQLAEDAAGNRYVVKRGNSPDHVRFEQTADDLYRAMGIDVPVGALFETPGGPVKVSRFLEGAQPLGSLTGKAKTDAFRELQKGFETDVLLGNWDVAGTGLDNVLVTPDGKVWRIDNGGSLKYRAQGGIKDAADWNRYPSEIWTMRDKSNISGPIYGDMDIFQIARQIDARSFDGLKDVPLDPVTREILEGRVVEMKHLATRALDFESGDYTVRHTDGVAKATLDLRKAGVSSTMPTKLASSWSPYMLTDQNGKDFGNLRTQSSGSTTIPQTPKVQGDVFGDDILTATKALASCALGGKDVASGSAPGKMAKVKAHVPDLKKLATTGTPEQAKMAADYLTQIDALIDLEKAGGIPAAVPPQFSPAIPVAQVVPTVQNAKSVVKQWEAQMAAEGINVQPIHDWMDSQSGNSWKPQTQALKVAFAKGMNDPEGGFYWQGNNIRTSWTQAQTHYQAAVKLAGGEEKLQRLVTSWHALTQEVLSEVEAPWIDRDRRAVLLLRTVSQEELDGSTQTPGKDGTFIPFRGVTESHSIYKRTDIKGNLLTAQAVPFSRVLATYWTEKPTQFGDSGFLGDSEAEFAANTSGIPALFKPSYKIPGTDEASKDATTWGVPIDHLRP